MADTESSDAILEVHEISKTFGALRANEAISLDLRQGEIHALIGPNGAGKSTLIKQISGGLKPDRGNIILNKETVTQLNTQQRARKGIGRTFQISALAMQDTVLQNVVLGVLGQQGRAMRFFTPFATDPSLLDPAYSALERVGLKDKGDVITAELSHGERRQLEVAVALTLNPKCFLMDEPMAGLGTSGSKQMTGFLDSLRTQAPILLVEHDMDAVFALADRISVLVYGKVIATGTIDEIKANPEVREAYLGEEA